MAIPGAAVGAPVIRTQSLIPLVERVGNQLELRKQREQQRQDRINKEWTDLLSEMDYNGLNTVQNSTISQQNDQLMTEYTSRLKAGDGQMDHADRLNFLQQQNRLKASADRMRAANDNVKLINQQMKDKGYYKDELMMQDVYNKLHTFDESTQQWVARDDVNPDDMAAMLGDSRYIDGDAYFKKDLEDFEKITAIGEQKGPLGSTLITDIETRDVWQRDDDGTISRGANGEPIPNMPMLMEELVKDPEKRKVYQDLARNAGQDLGDYLYDRVMSNTGYSERFRTAIRPYKPSATSGRQDMQDRRNRQAINKLADIYNQHEDVLANAVESDLPTPSGGLYDDITEQFPWALEKGQRPHQVLVDRNVPDTIFIIDEPGDEPRPVAREELPNLVNRIETMNANYKGLTDIGIQDQFFTLEGGLGAQRGRAPDVEAQQEFQQEAKTLAQHRNQLRTKYKNIDKELRGTLPFQIPGGVIPGITTPVGPERFRSLSKEDAQTLEDQLNQDFGGARMKLTKDDADALGLPSTTLTNMRFEVVPGQKQRVKIFSGDIEIDELTPEDFKALMDTGALVAGVGTLPKEPQRGMFDPEE